MESRYRQQQQQQHPDDALSANERRYMEEQLERCLDALDADTAREYVKAVELAPELVHSESSAWDFIRFEQYDLERAARRRAKYWKFRKYIFEERWLLPMTQVSVVVVQCIYFRPPLSAGRAPHTSYRQADRNRSLDFRAS